MNGTGRIGMVSTGFLAVALLCGGAPVSAGQSQSGEIEAWGNNDFGQTNVPAPNSDFVAIAAGRFHSMGLKTEGSIVAWGRNDDGQTDVPACNNDFVAIAGGGFHSLAIRAAEPECAVADLNCDGVVDGQDLLILLANWG